MSKKLLLVAATEAVDETVPVAIIEKKIKTKKDKPDKKVVFKSNKKTKGLIIESDSD